jgi:hypothetical protein
VTIRKPKKEKDIKVLKMRNGIINWHANLRSDSSGKKEY